MNAPESTPRRRLIRHLWIIVGALGVLLSAGLFLEGLRNIQQQETATFDFRSQTHVLRLQQALDDAATTLRDFGDLISSEFDPETVHPLTLDELQQLSASYKRQHVLLDDIAWAQQAGEDELPDLLAELDAAQNPQFEAQAGLLILHSQLDRFPPGHMLDEIEHLPPLIRAARQTRRMRAWMEEHDGQRRLYLMQPVYNRKDKLAGMLIGAWPLHAMLEAGIALEPVAGIDILVDAPLLGQKSPSRVFVHQTRAGDAGSSAGLEHQHSLDFHGLPLVITTRATPSFHALAGLSHEGPWIMLCLGLLLSGLASRHLYRQARFTELLRGEIKRQRDRILQQEARFERLMSVIPDAIGVHQDGQWIYVNPAAVSVFGARDARELLGSGVLERVHPDDRREVARRIREQIHQGRPAPLKETKLLRLDGRMFYGEVQGRPFTDESGRPAILVVMRDISARKLAQQELLALKQAISQAEDSIFITDASGRMVYANAACLKAFECPADGWQGRYAAELRGGRVGDATYNEIIERMDQGISIQREFRFLDARGEEHVVWRKISPVFDDGVVRWHVCVDHDLTQQKRMQQRIEHTHRLESLGVMAGGIAHDFNNLLAAIVGNSGLIARRVGPESPLHTYLDRINQASEQAASLCRQMLAYAGAEPLELEPVDLAACVGEMDQLLRLSLPRETRLRLEIEPDLPRIMGDVQKLKQLLLSLVSNAGEAVQDMSHEGVIQLRLQRARLTESELPRCLGHESLCAGEYLMLEVQDNGRGMDRTTRERAFEPFYTTKFAGRGLGLPAALGIVKVHGGGIDLSSRKNVGSRVRVYLPMLKQASASQSEAVESPVAKNGSGPGILIIDDDAMIRDMAAELLADISDTVLTAADGEEGLETFRKHRDDIAVVILDRTMPRMSGEECLRQLRAIDPGLRIIICSGLGENEDDALPADAFVSKPFHPVDLMNTIQQLSARSD